MEVRKKQKIELKRNKTILIDFDGVIHKYSKGWINDDIYDPPMDGAKEAIEKLINDGYEVIIFTARVSRKWIDRKERLHNVKEWLKRYQFPNVKISSEKIPSIYIIDDSAIEFKNWPSVLERICK